MLCQIVELRNKDIINMKDGTRLGYADDVEIDTCSGRVCAIVVYGRCKFFGILGYEDDIIIKWEEIKVIGDDTILVCADHLNRRQHMKPHRFGNFF